MALYKTGDRVVVRDDLRIGGYYYMLCEPGVRSDVRDTVVTDMKCMLGQTVTIEECYSKYKVEGSIRNWTDEMFAGLESEIHGLKGDCNVDEGAFCALLGG